MVPCGTANALAVSIGVTDHIDAVQRFIQNRRKQMDIAVVEGIQDKNKIYCFCVLSVGFHANMINTANTYLRWLGSVRFAATFPLTTIYNALARVQLRLIGAHRIDHSKKAVQYESTPSTTPTNENRECDKSCDISLSYFLATKMRFLEKGYGIAPYTQLDDGFIDVCLLEDASRTQLCKTLAVDIFKGRHIGSPGLEYYK
eukprot:Ihof_evm1s910 gene=Ihof_evmTU1s910